MKYIYNLLFGFLGIAVVHTGGYSQCVPLFGKLVINEVMPANSSTVTDPYGEYDDWVEIYNSTDEPINMEGYFLSDSHGNKTKFTFPNVDIQPNGFLIVWCDGQPEQGELHAEFKLSASTEKVGLYDPDTLILDYVRWMDAPDDISIGRYPNGHGPFSRLIPTFNKANTNSVGLGVVINEYQAMNETTAQDQWGAFGDWVELYNNSSDPIHLGGYFLSDKVKNPTLFEFPDTIIQPDSYIIVWCDKKVTDPGLHADFKLGAAGDQLLLSKPDTSTIDFVSFGPQIPDDSEGRFSNGSGPINCMAPSFSANNGYSVSVEELRKKTFFEVFPNPATDWIHVALEGVPNQETIRIFDMQGRLLKEVLPQDSLTRISTSSFAPGVYVIQIGTTSKKVILQ